MEENKNAKVIGIVSGLNMASLQDKKEPKILIVEDGMIGMSAERLKILQKEHGADLIIMTPSEAIDKEVPNIPKEFTRPFKLTAPPMESYAHYGNPPSGKESRRERRAKERKFKKK